MIRIMCYCLCGVGYSATMKETIKKILDENQIESIVDNCKFNEVKDHLNDYDYFITGKQFANFFKKQFKDIKDKSKFFYFADGDSYLKTKEDLVNLKIIKENNNEEKIY